MAVLLDWNTLLVGVMIAGGVGAAGLALWILGCEAVFYLRRPQPTWDGLAPVQPAKRRAALQACPGVDASGRVVWWCWSPPRRGQRVPDYPPAIMAEWDANA